MMAFPMTVWAQSNGVIDCISPSIAQRDDMVHLKKRPVICSTKERRVSLTPFTNAFRSLLDISNNLRITRKAHRTAFCFGWMHLPHWL
jgi:hypothetical protein